jgi:hypothetical protein
LASTKAIMSIKSSRFPTTLGSVSSAISVSFYQL